MLNVATKLLSLPVFGTDIRHDVLVEELEDERDAVGKHQMLGDDLKLEKEEAIWSVLQTRKLNTRLKIFGLQ